MNSNELRKAIIDVMNENELEINQCINIIIDMQGVKFPEGIIQQAIDWVKEELKKNPPELRKQWLQDALMNLQAKL